VVEVGEEQGEVLLAPGAVRDRLLEPAIEVGPVPEPGEGVDLALGREQRREPGALARVASLAVSSETSNGMARTS